MINKANKPSLGEAEMDRVMTLSAITSLVVTLAAYPFDWWWSARYAANASLATVNWIALLLILRGLANKNPISIVYGFMLKPLLLILLIAVAVNDGIEVTSFLSALNTFFLVLFGYMVSRKFRRSATDSRKTHSEAYG